MKSEKKYTRNYVGKGKPATSFSVKFTIPVEMIDLYKWEKDGVEYFTFETSKMKEADKYGRTHTAWVTTISNEEAADEENTPATEPELDLKMEPPKPEKTKKPRKEKNAA